MATESTLSAIPSRRIGRSVAAIVIGFVVVVVLSTAVDAVLHATGVYPPMGQRMTDGLFVLATAYRLLFSTFGCYLAARLAPRAPMRHALILGVVGFVAATLGAVATWNKPEMGPNWYPVLLIVTALPCAYLGGLLERRISAHS